MREAVNDELHLVSSAVSSAFAPSEVELAERGQEALHAAEARPEAVVHLEAHGHVEAEPLLGDQGGADDPEERRDKRGLLLLFGLVTQQEDLEEMVQIKVLQIIMMILDPKHTERMNKKFFNHVLVSCFQLYGSTSAMVKSTI